MNEMPPIGVIGNNAISSGGIGVGVNSLQSQNHQNSYYQQQHKDSIELRELNEKTWHGIGNYTKYII